MADSGLDESGDWTPQFEGQRPPLRPGNEHRVAAGNDLAVKHGAHSPLRLTPRAAEIADQLREIVPTYRPADEPTVLLLSGVLARIEAVYAWIDEHGLLRDGVEPQPILARLSTWENTASRLLAALGCTPLTRAQLGLDVARTEQALSITDLAIEAERERQAGG